MAKGLRKTLQEMYELTGDRRFRDAVAALDDWYISQGNPQEIRALELYASVEARKQQNPQLSIAAICQHIANARDPKDVRRLYYGRDPESVRRRYYEAKSWVKSDRQAARVAQQFKVRILAARGKVDVNKELRKVRKAVADKARKVLSAQK